MELEHVFFVFLRIINNPLENKIILDYQVSPFQGYLLLLTESLGQLNSTELRVKSSDKFSGLEINCWESFSGFNDLWFSFIDENSIAGKNKNFVHQRMRRKFCAHKITRANILMISYNIFRHNRFEKFARTATLTLLTFVKDFVSEKL